MNKHLLEYEIKSRNHSTEDVCKAIGMSRAAFFRKCSDKYTTEFTQSEIQKIVDYLELDSPMPIFFANSVACMQHN